MIFIGDVHGEFAEYRSMLGICGDLPSIQLGDMGIGFGCDDDYDAPPAHRFFRGNHDNPVKCRAIPNYLGDFGYIEDEGVFFVSGAESPDMYLRQPHVNWWEEEELNYGQMARAFELYKTSLPKIVATHDCPLFLLRHMYPKRRIIESSTAKFLEALFEVHQPAAWVFAHHHKSFHFSIKGTEFFGLRILEMLKLTETEVVGDWLGDDECAY